ncbi:MAG: RnfABCDGE type electron transport complex subunit D, partial [Clostridiales bacterium]|nr:RnfABCDGE type electron transport complex subunit D [Clostridiales bacterium]
VKILIFAVAGAVLSEAVAQKIMKRPITINDWSAVVTGILLAFNIPASAPWWIPFIGSIFAIVIVKQIFGGLGHNFMNPALAARAMLLASWPVQMTSWITPGPDAVSTATPLAILGGTADAGSVLPSLASTLIGNTSGCIGETSALFLILGGLYLLYKRVITPRIPIIYIATVAVLTFILGGFDMTYMIYHVLSGGLMLGAIYMATDYSSSPITPKGQIIFALGCGILTTVIRLYGGYPEGVSYSILFMNVATPLIDKYTSPRVFGEVK